MAKSKLTLIVDGNWLLMSRLAVLNNRFDTPQELMQNVKKLLIRSISVALRTFPMIDNIIFVSDGGSWRTDIAIPENLSKKQDIGEIQSASYKGTREKSDDIDWDTIFAGFEDFTNTLNTNGISAFREKGVEGDDWAFFWSTYLNSQGTNCIIWTADKDLTQLVKTDKNSCFTVWWNAKSGIICEDKDDNDMDFFFNNQYNVNQNVFNDVVNKVNDIKKINPSDVVIEKILKGDASDNIQPIMVRRSKNVTSQKKFKISSKDIDYNLNYNNDNDVLNYISEVYNSKSYQGRVEDSIDEVFEHFKYNRKLVELSKTELPIEIYNKMASHINELKYSADISKAESVIMAQTNEIANIAEMI